MKKELEIGAMVPELTLQDQEGKNVAIKTFVGQKVLVIYFYPKDETPGCTAQACSFRDSFEAFEELGAKVIGISGDSVKAHQKFSSKHNLNFTLLSDKHRIAEKAFGVKRNLFGLLPGRVTYVFDLEGKLIHKYDSATQATSHIPEALKAIKKLNGQ